MTKLEQAARQLLEAVEDFEGYRQDIYTAIADLREAMEEESCHKQAQRIAELEQAARQALGAFEAETHPDWDCNSYHPKIYPAIEALRDALDVAPEPVAVEQEPVGFMNAGHLCELENRRIPYVYVYPCQGTGADVPVYAAPQPARQPLSALPYGDIVFFSDRGDAVSGYSAQRVWEILRTHGIGGEV